MEDFLETSTSSLIDQNDAMPRNKYRNFLLATFPAISAIFLLASFATAPLQMLTLFNSCPSLPSTPFGNITCDDSTSSPVVGTVCKVNCPVGYPSTGQLESRCSWTGRWTNDEMKCTAHVGILLAGESWGHGNDDKSTAEVFFTRGAKKQNVTIQPYPYIMHYGMAGFVDGIPMFCGGYDGKVLASCYSLQRDGKWSLAPAMPQERWFASSAVIDQGSSLWILGGMDNSGHPYSSTIMWSSSSGWVDGPALTSPRALHCSVTLPNQDVLVIGGGGPPHGHAVRLVERFSSGQWTTEAPLHQARAHHVCSHVWMYEFSIAYDAQDKLSGVVVAGGNTIDSSHVHHPVFSVELLYKGEWVQLPPLPVIHKPDWRMSLPTSLVWLPSHGLRIVGGCYFDYHKHGAWCTRKVWDLLYDGGDPPNITYHWEIQNYEELETAMFPGNGAVSIPSTYFN